MTILIAFSEQQFARFVRFVVGLWISKPTRTGVVFEPLKVSLAQGMLNEQKRSPLIEIENVSYERMSDREWCISGVFPLNMRLCFYKIINILNKSISIDKRLF